MPISSDPNATAEFFLEVDRAKPAAKRPVFLVRFMTGRDLAQIESLIEQAEAQPSTSDGNAAAYTLLCRAIAIGVVGWRNMAGRDGVPLAFDAAKLESLLGADETGWSLLSERELWELATLYSFAARPAGADRFLSAWRREFDGASSAPDATSPAVA